MEKRLTNKRLVRKLMDKGGYDMISINKDVVLFEANEKMTPEKAYQLCQELGQPDARYITTKEKKNYIVFKRF